jgi:hypothetical protein
MKNLFNVFVLLLLLNLLTTAQEENFKTVYIAKDVIDNYITAIGGLEKISKIHTVKMEGKTNIMGTDLNITSYTGIDYYYMILQNNNFCEITAYNDKTRKGWHTMNGKPVNLDDEAVNHYTIHSVNYWGKYVDGYDLGVKCVFNEQNTDTGLFAVSFYKDETLLSTVYFNKSDFLKVKSDMNGQIKYYSDYKKVGECGIIMPFLITSTDTLVVTGYKFNQSFNKQLLDKKSLDYFQP